MIIVGQGWANPEFVKCNSKKCYTKMRYQFGDASQKELLEMCEICGSNQEKGYDKI